MKVQMLRNPGAAWGCNLAEGETGTVDTLTGKRLVAAGVAVEIVEPKQEPKPEEIKAVPATPAIAEPKPASIKAPVKETEASASEVDAKQKPAASKVGKSTVPPTTTRGKNPEPNKEI